MRFSIPLLLVFILISLSGKSENGYDLWLRYTKLKNESRLAEYKKQITAYRIVGNSPTLSIASDEMNRGLNGLLGTSLVNLPTEAKGNYIICGRLESNEIKQYLQNSSSLNLGTEGYTLQTISKGKQKITLIAANEDIGVLYGIFHFLRLLQTEQPIHQLSIVEIPKVKLRVLNHWDNLDRTVERGYAGFSLWNWHKLPNYIDQRYIDYARANASIGINGTVLTNVNANALILTDDYLKKVEALANAFRPYGIKVYLTARFSAPIELGDLSTADPLDPKVQAWWNDKAKSIYKRIPDFGGFLVKANSEGQPGPQNYGRSHKDGANMLATAVEPYNGVVIWRAFVYDNNVPDDRAKQAYTEFKPLDGTFKKNVLIQVKNGAIDFQPREPFHPLFGAMPNTPLMMEFQITQEYLGFSTHLVYLSTLFKECLEAGTKINGQNTSVASIIDGTTDQHALSGMAGVANIGTDINWCGHPFAQSNWYAFGRLAWNHTLTSTTIADEWIRMTFSNENNVIETLKEVMMASREITVNYMTPLGLHHIMGWSHHHGPSPWIKDKHRADWTSVYYHKADSNGIGFNRTITGSNAIGQYSKAIAEKFSSVEECPEEFLLWFHHVSWDHRVKSGRTLWDELCHRYYDGVDSVLWMQKNWLSLKGKIDEERFTEVASLLDLQYEEASIWRDACVLYFQTFSKRPIPATLPQPKNSLDYYKKLSYPHAPGIKPEW